MRVNLLLLHINYVVFSDKNFETNKILTTMAELIYTCIIFFPLFSFFYLFIWCIPWKKRKFLSTFIAYKCKNRLPTFLFTNNLKGKVLNMNFVFFLFGISSSFFNGLRIRMRILFRCTHHILMSYTCLCVLKPYTPTAVSPSSWPSSSTLLQCNSELKNYPKTFLYVLRIFNFLIPKQFQSRFGKF